MIRPGDRDRVLAYLRHQAARGFGVTPNQVYQENGLRHLKSAAEARAILDGLVAAGLVTSAIESRPRERYGIGSLLCYRATAAAATNHPSPDPIRQRSTMK